MSRTKDRRSQVWGRGSFPLSLESLERRELLAADVTSAVAAPAATPTVAAPAVTTPVVPSSAPDISGVSLATAGTLYWGDSFHAQGTVVNQGTSPTTTPFNVGIYASSTPTIGANSVLLGEVSIPSGLAPGAKATFNQAVSLPTTSIPTNASGSIYIDTQIDPEKVLSESNTANNSGVGVGIDSSVVAIAKHGPAQLVGSSLTLSPDQASWGSSIQLTAQIQNTGQGNAPATIASIVLSPSGESPGGPGDVTLNHINIPALDAGQTANITQSVVLPGVAPTSLAGGTTYTLSLATDSSYITNQFYPHIAAKGLGFDMAQLSIATPANAPASPTTQPDLTVAAVTAPTTPIALGQTFQATSYVQNVGNADAGPVTVRYLLVGNDGSLSNGLFLADTTVTGLKANYGEKITQNLQIPSVLPAGMSLNSSGTAKIAVVVNPENAVQVSSEANKSATSKTILIQYVNSNGTTVNPTTTNTTNTPTTNKKGSKVSAAEVALVAKAKTLTAQQKTDIATKRLQGHSISHNVKAFPKRAETYFKKLFKL